MPSREVGQGSAEHKEVGLGLEMTSFKDLGCSSVYEQKFGRSLWRVIALGCLQCLGHGGLYRREGERVSLRSI